jgi:heat shock protein HslJ
VVVLIAILLFARGAAAPAAQPAQTPTAVSEGRASTDPQKLMIPRWLLTSMVLDGQEIALPESQLSLQFEGEGKANGEGGCNSFFTDYQVAEDGAMQFGPVGATKMFCEGAMEAENAYFQALGKVSAFRTEDWKLFLTSGDGQTALVFSMPPK